MCSQKRVLAPPKFANGLNTDLPLGAWIEKTVHEVKTHWLSGKENILEDVL